MNNINFTGNYITSLNVLKKNKYNEFVPHKVSLVEIDALNEKDIFALKEIERDWDEPYTEIISDDAQMIFKNTEKNLFHRFFVLTNQKDNFNNLLSDEVLAATEISSFPAAKNVNIDVLQVDPDNNYYSCYRNYKKIGSTFLDGIKNIFKGKEITVQSAPSALPFYLKNKFHRVSKNSNNLHFSDV